MFSPWVRCSSSEAGFQQVLLNAGALGTTLGTLGTRHHWVAKIAKIPWRIRLVLIYMLTWLGYIDGIHVTIYGSTMNPMGVGIMFIQIGYDCSIISRSSWQIDANRIKLRVVAPCFVFFNWNQRRLLSKLRFCPKDVGQAGKQWKMTAARLLVLILRLGISWHGFVNKKSLAPVQNRLETRVL